MLLHFRALAGGNSSSASDTTPDAFSFTDQTNVELSTVITSNSVTIIGINASATVTITGGEHNIAGAGWSSASSSVSNGQSIQVRHTSSGSNSTAVNTVLTVGGISDTFTSTTESASSLTDLSQLFRQFNYDARTNGTAPTDTGVTYHDDAEIDGTNLFGSHKSVKHTLPSPSGASGIFGDEWDYTGWPTDPSFGSGHEMWILRTIKVSSSFSFLADGNLKWIRMANLRQSISVNTGWLDIYIHDIDGSMKFQNELTDQALHFDAQDDAELAALDYKFPKNTWVALQCYVNFHPTAGKIRVWADNTLVYEKLNIQTWQTGNSVFYTYWNNYWNGAGLPAANVGNNMWSSLSALAIKTSGRDDTSHLTTDSRGNLFIKVVE